MVAQGQDPAKFLGDLRSQVTSLDANKQYDEAQAIRKIIVRDYPQFHAVAARTQYEIARYYEQRGQTEDAIREYRILGDDYPKDEIAAEGLWKVAVYDLSKRRKDDAKQSIQKILDRFPNISVRSQIKLMKDKELAVEMRRVLISLLPNSPGECASLQRENAESYKNRGLLEKAVKEYKVLAEEYASHPTTPEALFMEAFCGIQIRKLSRAGACLKRLIEEYPDWGYIEEAVKQNIEAIAWSSPREGIEYCKSIANDSKWSDGLRAYALMMAGRIEADRGRTDEALRYFDTCISWYPEDSILSKYFKCRVQISKGDLDGAEATQQGMAAGNPWTLMALGHIQSVKCKGYEARWTFGNAVNAAVKAKATEAEGMSLLYGYYEELKHGVSWGVADAKRELVRKAPIIARKFIFQLEEEFEAYVKSLEPK